MSSSCRVCAWRTDDCDPGARRVRFTPKLASPKKSPSARFSRPATRAANGSG
jgi:hypothetical protein